MYKNPGAKLFPELLASFYVSDVTQVLQQHDKVELKLVYAQEGRTDDRVL